MLAFSIVLEFIVVTEKDGNTQIFCQIWNVNHSEKLRLLKCSILIDYRKKTWFYYLTPSLYLSSQ